MAIVVENLNIQNSQPDYISTPLVPLSIELRVERVISQNESHVLPDTNVVWF